VDVAVSGGDRAGKTVDFGLESRRDVTAAKAFFRKAFRSQGSTPRTITLDAMQRHTASHLVIASRRMLAPATVGIEACAGVQHWACQISGLGHQVQPLSSRLVKAYLPLQRNNAADAAAICEAAARPAVCSVRVEANEQQAGLSLLRTRELFVRQRTGLTNALRGHLAEFGFVAPRGRNGVTELASYLEHPDLPTLARTACRALVE
jgi:transposase